jgi:class 3 adenylate cyclase
MPAIADWLTELGMSEYAQCFAENAIDLSVLPHLTERNLKDIGVVPGDRRKMLAAIAEFAEAELPPKPSAATLPKPQESGERRHVTVMFCDLVGSTALSTRMDVEDLREVIAGYQACVTDFAHRFGGFLAKFMGDGALVYFGYPQAHEDDAERAMRAGLALIAAVTARRSNYRPASAFQPDSWSSAM